MLYGGPYRANENEYMHHVKNVHNAKNVLKCTQRKSRVWKYSLRGQSALPTCTECEKSLQHKNRFVCLYIYAFYSKGNLP